MTRRIALITCAELPEPDPDEALLLEALRGAGHVAELLAWDDPQADPAAFELCVLRSCWNYYRAPMAFRAWIDDAAARSRLVNPSPVAHWNLHKRYLRDLAAAGVPIVPTAWLSSGNAKDLAQILDARRWGDFVLKPAVSAASYRTRRFDGGPNADLAAAERFVGELTAEGDALLQPWLPGFADPGERSLVWIDGEITHAVRKSPRFEGQAEQVCEATPVTTEDLDLAGAALARFDGELLYARIDVIRDPTGLLVSELELIEPSLFLAQSPAALARFVAAIGRRLGPDQRRPGSSIERNA